MSPSGLLSGTPTSGGSYGFTVTVTDSVGVEATQSFTLVIDQVAAITSAANATFTAGSSGSFTVQATGYPAPTLSETGMLPSGLTFDADTGLLSGTPAGGTGGDYSLTFTAHNGIGGDATQSFVLTVDQGSSITSGSSATFTAGSAGSFTVMSTGDPTPMLSETGSLPAGITFMDNGDGTASLAGSPSATSGGSYPITITAHNGVGQDATQSFTLVVDQSAAITSAAAVTLTTGSAGSFTVQATGYPTPTLSATGALPSGVTFNAATGVLSGTPASGTGGAVPVDVYRAQRHRQRRDAAVHAHRGPAGSADQRRRHDVHARQRRRVHRAEHRLSAAGAQ